jgi:hypothetical protein
LPAVRRVVACRGHEIEDQRIGRLVRRLRWLRVAQFRLDVETGKWSTFWPDRNGKWLLDEDPYCCIWG